MKITEAQLQAYAINLWDEYCEIFPKLVNFDCPKIVLKSTMRKDAAECQMEDNEIRVNKRFFKYYADNMLRVIIPHELAHQIDYNLNGMPKRECGHGMEWAIIMIQIGQEPYAHHNMDWKKK